MSFGRMIVSALSLLLVGGCAAVVVDQPIGIEPVRLDSARWEGTWLHEDGAVDVEIEDAEAGLLRLAWAEGTGDAATVETLRVHLRRAGEGVLVSTPEPDAAEPRYLWGLLVRVDDELIVVTPDAERFRALVEAGALPGSVEGKSVLLTALDPEHVRLIAAQERGALFHLDDPLTLRRAAR